MILSTSNTKQFQLTEDGRTLLLGRNAQKHVEQEHKVEIGLVQTLPPNTVELVVPEMLKKVGTATLSLAQVRITMLTLLPEKLLRGRP